MTIRLSNSQDQGPGTYRLEGYIPDPMFPGRDWLSGLARLRPHAANHGTVYHETDRGWALIYFCPIHQMGSLEHRPDHLKQGATYWATDVDKVYVWMD